VRGKQRLGPCVGKVGNFIAIGFAIFRHGAGRCDYHRHPAGCGARHEAPDIP
jgi:hypothetical protein